MNVNNSRSFLRGSIRMLWWSACGVALFCSATGQNVWHVSPTGSDLGAGDESQPFRSINRARDAIRARSVDWDGDIRVILHGGDYNISETIRFSQVDSGRNGFKVVYTCAVGEQAPRLVGGRRVHAWEEYGDGIYRSMVGSNEPINTLTEDSVRGRCARYPNHKMSVQFPLSQGEYLVSTGKAGSRTQVVCQRPEFEPPLFDPRGTALVIWSGGKWDWFMDVVPVASFSRDQGEFILSEETRYPVNQSSFLPPFGSRFYIQNALAFLDAPGEFYYDQEAGWLYYMPRFGSPETHEILIPTVKTHILLEGTTNSVVHDVEFDGLQFVMSDFADSYRFGCVRGGDSGETHYYPSFDRQVELPRHRVGMLQLRNTHRVSVRRCSFLNSGYSAIYVDGLGRDLIFRDNLIRHSGYNGIWLQGGYPGEGDCMNQNTISGNNISHIGEILGHASGIGLSNAGNNSIISNTVHDGPRYGLQIGSDWGIRPEFLYSGSNTVRDLHLSGLCQDSGDTGSLYTWGLGNGCINTFSQIIIEHFGGHPSVHDYPPNAIFMDEETTGQVFKDVLIKGSQAEPFRSNPRVTPYYFDNVSWRSGFEIARFDTTRVGSPMNVVLQALSRPTIRFDAGRVTVLWFQYDYPRMLLESTNLTNWGEWSITGRGTEPVVIGDVGTATFEPNHRASFYRVVDSLR